MTIGDKGGTVEIAVGLIGAIGVLVGTGVSSLFESRRLNASLERDRWHHERDLALATQKRASDLEIKKLHDAALGKRLDKVADLFGEFLDAAGALSFSPDEFSDDAEATTTNISRTYRARLQLAMIFRPGEGPGTVGVTLRGG